MEDSLTSERIDSRAQAIATLRQSKDMIGTMKTPQGALDPSKVADAIKESRREPAEQAPFTPTIPAVARVSDGRRLAVLGCPGCSTGHGNRRRRVGPGPFDTVRRPWFPRRGRWLERP